MNEAYLVHKLCRRQRRNLPKPYVVGSDRLSVAKSELKRHVKLHGSRRYRRRHSVRHTAARNVAARSVAGMLVDRLPCHHRSRNQTYVVAASTLLQVTDVLTRRRRRRQHQSGSAFGRQLSRSAHLPSRLAQRWARRYFLEPV